MASATGEGTSGSIGRPAFIRARIWEEDTPEREAGQTWTRGMEEGRGDQASLGRAVGE